MVQHCFHHHQRESAANAISRAYTKGQIGFRVDVALILLAESFWIEFLWVWKILWVSMQTRDGEPNHCVFFNGNSFVVIFQREVLRAESVNKWSDGPQS